MQPQPPTELKQVLVRAADKHQGRLTRHVILRLLGDMHSKQLYQSRLKSPKSLNRPRSVGHRGTAFFGRRLPN